MPRDLDAEFVRHHSELFTLDFWTQTQARLEAGDVIDIFAYSQSRRLANRV
jgi:isocitrate dehydrogenase kinase/phosphatase